MRKQTVFKEEFMGERKDGAMRCCWLFEQKRKAQRLSVVSYTLGYYKSRGRTGETHYQEEKREDFYGELGDHKQETRECQRVNEFVANTSL